MKAKDEENCGYGEIKSATTKFENNEPLFLIRATDPFAVHVLIEYARRIERQGATEAHTDRIFEQAMTIAEWQRDHPELISDIWNEPGK